jgi:adenylate cyclase
MARRLAAILAADVAGYSRLMGADEAGTLAALKACRAELINPKAVQYGARTIKLMGDGVLMEFASVVDAVAFAVEVQVAIRSRNADVPEDQRLQFRIGINIGDVIAEGDDIYGDGVNVAARLEGLAEPGGICIGRNVRNQIRDKLDLTFKDLGEIEVKNIARSVRAFHIVMDDKAEALATPIAVVTVQRSQHRLGAIAATLALSIGIALALIWWQPWVSDSVPFSDEAAGLPLPGKPSIAVLPFTNLSDDRAQEYFADGLTDDLITDLSKVSGLLVIARNSVFTFKGKPVRIEEVARELGVQYVVEGSVRRSGDQVRVNTQLVDGASGRHVWAERYNRNTTDLFAVQDDLVSQIVAALAVQLTGREERQLAARQVPEFEAYDLYLQARDGFFSRDQDRMHESLGLFARAWEIDPNFARAYAGYARLAADIWRLSSLRFTSGAPMRRSAEVAARQAIALDPTLADSYSVLALMRMVDSYHQAAKALARQAVELDPNSAEALTTLAIVLTYAGEPEAALAAMTTSLRLNPRPTPHQLIYHGLALFLNGRFEEAIEVLEPIAETRDRGLGDSPREILAMAYAEIGAAEEARAQIDALHVEEPFLNLAYFRVVYDHHARQEDLRRRLDALRKAGLPEWPHGFEEDPDMRLPQSALRELIEVTTWTGEDAGRQVSFIQEFGADGSAVYAAPGSLLTGSAIVKGDELCERYEGFVLSRDLCGPVFQSPEATATSRHPYTYVNPTTVRYFSLAN